MHRITITKESHFTFSAGETHVRLSDNAEAAAKLGMSLELVCLDYSMSGLMAVCEYAQVLRRLGTKDIHLVYPYLPYSRQDRVIHDHEPFSLKLFCDIINAQGFTSVTTWDPHSDVGPALLDHCTVVPQWEIARKIIPSGWLDDPKVLVVSPDAGAYKKVAKLIASDDRIAIGVKVRGDKGRILCTNVFSPTDIEGRACLIVDDICDGGRTFVELAKTLKAKGVAGVALYVTHGIFSKGFVELEEAGITAIYTTDSFRHPQVPGWVDVTEFFSNSTTEPTGGL